MPRHPRPSPAVSSIRGLQTPAPRLRGATFTGPPSANLHDRITLADGRSLLVYPNQQTFSESSAYLQGAQVVSVSCARNVWSLAMNKACPIPLSMRALPAVKAALFQTPIVRMHALARRAISACMRSEERRVGKECR